jgi:RHS repeat-associated protein
LTLPTGGGAIKGISETFRANPVTGTASLSIPLPVASGRGFVPNLTLAYDSGSGNGPFGLGWQVAIPAISRKTDQRLPRYRDGEESDIFQFSGLEDLVPLLHEVDGSWAPHLEIIEEDGLSFEVKRYRPRTEGGYQRIERWRSLEESGDVHWRVRSRDNVLAVFGATPAERIVDPADPARIFRWLLSYRQDDKGNRVVYLYKREDLEGVDAGLAFERHRAGLPQANLYPKKALYGNRVPYWQRPLSEDDYLFQTVFDYGEHDDARPAVTEAQAWPVRPDPFSTYRAGFEVRTYRRCRRVLLFHNFAALGDDPTLVRSLDLAYGDPEQESRTPFSLLRTATQRGYQRKGDGYATLAWPPVTFDYQPHHWQTDVETIDAGAQGQPPGGVDGQRYRWLDLYGEGLTGILAVQASRLTYRSNLGQGVFGPERSLSSMPSPAGASPGAADFRSLAADGQLSLVTDAGSPAGYFRLEDDATWASFAPFEQLPAIDLRDPNLRRIDLTGNGQPDLLITEDRVLRWYPAAGLAGYGEAEEADPLQSDAQDGPALIFANESESIFLADMSGDGLQDVVRIRNGSVVYWPNLGYGRFGSQVTMARPPQFDRADHFDPARLRPADLDGTGTADLLYVGRGEIRYWLNRSGNSWSEAHGLPNPFPEVNNQTSVSVFDLLGSGTACIVWSSSLPAHARQPVRYIDLMGSVKPHLMAGYSNGMGKRIQFAYVPSTAFYLADRAAGTPWVTKLHFPVHCLSKVESTDEITGARFTSEYRYHHGYYDRAEREFRGFGRVDQLDTETFEHFVASGAANVLARPLYQPPVLTKTWFHTGAAAHGRTILGQYQHEYYRDEDFIDMPLPDPELPPDLTAAEWREALRACRGLALRSEVYGLDDAEEARHPYAITAATCQIVQVQPAGPNQHAVFQVIERESLSVQLDRDPTDPRVAHSLVLEVNEYGQPLLTAAVGYPRRLAGPTPVRDLQNRYTITVAQIDYTEDLDEDSYPAPHNPAQTTSVYRLRQACQQRTWELGHPPQFATDPPWQLMTRPALVNRFNDPQIVEIAYGAGPAGDGQRRLLQQQRTYFLRDDCAGPLPLRMLGGLGLSYQTQGLAFTDDLAEELYEDRVDETMLEEGGYTHSRDSIFQSDTWIDGPEDAGWWVPSATPVFDSDPAEYFYRPIGARDPFGNVSEVVYDPYYLLPVRSVDALGNQTRAVNDYRLLQPVAAQDANGNWNAIQADARGMVVKSAALGKLPPGVDPLTATASEGDTLAHPSVELIYDLHNWQDRRLPNYVKTVAWEEHFAADPQRTKTQVKLEYSDGGGNVVMVKAQAAPGLAKARRPDGTVEEVDTTPEPRWIGNGRTIRNNKGNPVKQYEPYFSTTSAYEDAAELVEVGFSPLVFYDAAGRQACTLLPNHSFTKMITTPWRSESWDVNDTLLIENPALDPHVGTYFAGLDEADYLPGWHAARSGGALGPEAQRAAQIAVEEGHPATPAVTHTDALGRTVYAEADNGPGGVYATWTVLDIEGNTLSVIDARDNAVMTNRYNLLPPPDEETPKPALVQESMDGGTKRLLPDVTGNPLYAWDSRGHRAHTIYDALRRPTRSWVRNGGEEQLVGLTIYGEAAPAAEANNLRGQVWMAYDQSGLTETVAVDFKGNPLETRRTLAVAYDRIIDWQDDPADLLQGETFSARSEYDALNRVIRSLSPHHAAQPASELRLAYDAGGGLDRVDLRVRGGAWTTYVDGITYDAKGQRQSIRYGNGVTTRYAYEPETYRLTRLWSERGGDGATLQDLRYAYDPAGNITEIRDQAQQTVFFANQAVAPHSRYRYDALYRLVEATGREHAGQTADHTPVQGWSPQPHPNSGQHLRRYTQHYAYDSVGNILELQHVAAGGNWTRTYAYAAGSNRLLETVVGDMTEPYTYNAHGSITRMNHLPELVWDFAEQLREVVLDAAGGLAHYVYDGSGQRVRKVHEHAGGTVEERIYLGGWEIYRKRINGNLTLARETLHVMDDRKRIALVETQTVVGGAPVANPQPLARYQLGNHLGSAALELNDAGEIISYEEFHPYGTTAYHAGTAAVEESPKRYRYTGKERDEETGFSYHGARYLSGGLGRWLSVDPSGTQDGLNLYCYVHDNPVGGIDPSGRSFLPFVLLLQSDNGAVDLNETGAQPLITQEHVDALAQPIEEYLSPVRQGARDFWQGGGNNVVVGAILVGGGAIVIIGTGGAATPFVLFSSGMAVGAGTFSVAGGVTELGMRGAGLVGDEPNAMLSEQEASFFNRMVGTGTSVASSPFSMTGGAIGYAYTGDMQGIEAGAAVGGLVDLGYGVKGIMSISNRSTNATGRIYQLSADPVIRNQPLTNLPGMDVMSSHGNAAVIEVFGFTMPAQSVAPLAMASDAEVIVFATCSTAKCATTMQKLANSTNKTVLGFN